jgi:hypothetical protein
MSARSLSTFSLACLTLLGTAAAPAFGQDKDIRHLWKFGAGNYFEQKGGTGWVEYGPKGITATFVETKRTDAFVEIFDKSRNVTVQLYKDHCDSKGGKEKFKLLYNGRWINRPRGDGTYFAQASTRLVNLINQAKKDGYDFQDNQFSLGGGWLEHDPSTFVPLFQVYLKAGVQYRLLAAGSNDAKDVDLHLTSPDGKIVYAKDEGTEPEAHVNFTPKIDGLYIVRLRLYDSKDQKHCVCVTLLMQK